MRTRKLMTFLAALMVFGGVLAACGDPTPEKAADDSPKDADSSVAELDLASLEAEAPEGTYHAEAIEPAYVGEVDSDLFIGVELDPDAEGAQDVRAYVCNGQDVIQWVSGKLDAAGTGSLAPKTIAEGAPEVSVDLKVDEEVTGSVSINGEDQSFTLTRATGDAGLYRAEETFDGDNFVAGWVVLSDGRQIGGDCELRCGRNPRTGDKVCFCLKKK